MARAEDADRLRSFDTLLDNNVRIGLAMRSNGYYWLLNHPAPNVTFYDDVTEKQEGRTVVKAKAFDRVLKALLDGEIDCTLENTIEVRAILKKRGLTGRLVITNLHERRKVTTMDEVEHLYNIGLVELHTPILLGNYNDYLPAQDEPEPTTVGRAIFNRILPDELRFVQETQDKKALQKLVTRSYQRLGSDLTTDIVDAIKDLGFHFATISGTTIAVSDLTIPEERIGILTDADATSQRLEREFNRGSLTEDERYLKTIEIWTGAKDQLQDLIRNVLNPYGPIAIMAISGATKGGFGPITQLAGMRGLMADPSGRIIDLPIRSHFREGLTALEYFISTHGARKGLADTALRTADAGYLTRRLVDVAQEVIINRTDCGTKNGIWVRRSDDIAGQSLYERIIGRCSAQDVTHPETGDLIVARKA